MLRGVFFFVGAVLAFVFGAELQAQTPARSPSASPPATATPAPSPTPSSETLINLMTSADLQQGIQLLKSNYLNPEALNETELNRALLMGLMTRLGPGFMVLPARAPDSESANPFYSEVIENHISYLRVGALTTANLKSMDAALQNLSPKKVDAVVLDLRASSGANDFALAAEFAKRFVAKGKPLFTLRRTASKQERSFTSDADPAYHGLMIILADSDTAGAAEALGGILRVHDKALVIGQTTAGQAMEYADLPLNGGRVLRVAVAEAVLPEGRALFPTGLKPDLPVEMPAADKRVVFQQSSEKGMSQFVFESERPHLNEAALLSGRNPELEADTQRRGRGNEKMTRDPVLQRAIDVITSLSIYQQR
jgi:hypothetical protein